MAELEDLIHLGKFWAGSTGLPIPVVFARTGGGYLNCTDPINQRNALCTSFIRRWDSRRQQPLAQIISTCVLTEVDPPHGRYLLDWRASDLASVPTDPGVYVLQVDLILPDGTETYSQRALFEVLPTGPAPF